jgi:hypothetical protein
MIGIYDSQVKGWRVVCDVCGAGPLGHVAGVAESQPSGYLGFFCAEHAPVVEVPTEEPLPDE